MSCTPKTRWKDGEAVTMPRCREEPPKPTLPELPLPLLSSSPICLPAWCGPCLRPGGLGRTGSCLEGWPQARGNLICKNKNKNRGNNSPRGSRLCQGPGLAQTPCLGHGPVIIFMIVVQAAGRCRRRQLRAGRSVCKLTAGGDWSLTASAPPARPPVVAAEVAHVQGKAERACSGWSFKPALL